MKILVPSDYSDCSANALQFAKALANHFQASIELVHFYSSLPEVAGQEASYKDHKPQTAQLRNEELMEQYLQFDQGGNIITEYKTYVIEGKVQTALPLFLKRNNYDLVVMGTNGESGINARLGSITKKLISTTETPLLAVPCSSQFSPFDKIAFTEDFDSMDLTSLGFLEKMVEGTESKVFIVHLNEVVDNGSVARSQNYSALKYQELRKQRNFSFQLVNGYDKIETLTEYIVNNEINLLAMVKRQTGKESQNGLIGQLVPTLDIPLLVFPK